MKPSSKSPGLRTHLPKAPHETTSTDRLGSVALLDRLLADTVFLSVQAQAIHWNYIGADFAVFHIHFEKRYRKLNQAADQVAERIRAVGALAPASLAEWIELSDLEEIPLSVFMPGEAGASEATEAETHNHRCLHFFRKAELQIVDYLRRTALPRAKELEDPVTEDLLTSRLADHEKSIWMVSSILGELVSEEFRAARKEAVA